MLAIAEEITRKERVLRLPRLHRLAVRTLKAPSRAVLAAINRLIDEKRIIPGSRLVRKNLLQNDLRAEIYRLVREDPGISFSGVRKRTGRGTKILLWHLSVLEEFECVVQIRVGRTTAYFTFEHAHRFDGHQLKTIALLRSKRAKALVNLFTERDSLGVSEVVDRLGWPRQTAQYHLDKLNDAGVLVKKQRGGKNRYSLAAGVKNLIPRT
ncbi:MAG: hypothetical protein Kow0069_07140 [Promethearchaeota archaeon]